MQALPDPEKMASLVSGVTQTMLGLTFVPDDARPMPRAREALVWRTVILPIPGEQPLTVGLSSDENGCARLAAAMFACSMEQLDDSMTSDALCELVNMTAGLLKAAMSLDQALGLPRVIVGGQAAAVPSASPHVIVLKADVLGLLLWIYEGVA